MLSTSGGPPTRSRDPRNRGAMAEGVRLLPVARVVPALTALSLVAPVCASLIGYEAIRYREGRAWIRSRRGAFTVEEAADAGRSREGDGRPQQGVHMTRQGVAYRPSWFRLRTCSRGSRWSHHRGVPDEERRPPCEEQSSTVRGTSASRSRLEPR